MKAVIVPQSVFLTNAKGFPVLPRAHQAFLMELVSKGVQARAGCTKGRD